MTARKRASGADAEAPKSKCRGSADDGAGPRQKPTPSLHTDQIERVSQGLRGGRPGSSCEANARPYQGNPDRAVWNPRATMPVLASGCVTGSRHTDII
jgi:hypothetical protein